MTTNSTAVEILAREIFALREDNDKFQDHIYIVAGVLGGVCLILLLSIVIMTVVAFRLSKKIVEVEENRRIADELKARKFSAYTGEEVHRRLQSAAPINNNKDSEYAFNNPVTSEYQLGAVPKKF
ncbi:uncharacterized protein LOC110844406 [Folsomia candida]|uniref:Envelope glycoprotein M n=1 Tax=Folsomia candida TaxID=158441 RepID=A0A226ET26_FOLCA|nr:uncharacterized protein LOC110844406 [Folsomia candida]OXA60368.1 Envelope glycoprotein M [Folsomia candida]